MRILSVDIGTNSTLYLIADVDHSDLKIIERGIVSNGLGANLTPDGRFPFKLLEANRQLLNDIMQRAAALGCAKSAAVGTAVLRTALNRDEFIDMASSLGLKVEVISDERETLLAWRGVFGPQGPTEFTALLDLGGGSTELSLGCGDRPEWSSSIPLGAVTLGKMGFISDPPTSSQIERVQQHIVQAFSVWREVWRSHIHHFNGGVVKMIGSAGTITALAALEYRILNYQPDIFTRLTLTPLQIQLWRDRLLTLSLPERQALPGMPPARAEFIHAGTLILSKIIELLDNPTLVVSDRGVMFGLAWEIAGMAKP